MAGAVDPGRPARPPDLTTFLLSSRASSEGPGEVGTRSAYPSTQVPRSALGMTRNYVYGFTIISGSTLNTFVVPLSATVIVMLNR